MTHLALSLHRLSQVLHRALTETPDLDVTPAEALVLTLLRRDGPTAVGEVVDALGARASTVTTILDRLNERKFIVRQVRPDDRRSFLVLLTERGQEEALRAERAVASAETTVLEAVPTERRAAVRAALEPS